MSILEEKIYKCSNCGQKSKHKYFVSWNSLINGSKTIHGFDTFGPNLLMECPYCGFVSTNLERENKQLADGGIEEINKLYEEKYGDLFENDNYSREYLKYYLSRIREDSYNVTEALFALAKAIYYSKGNPNRKILVDELKQLITELDNEDIKYLIRYLDLLRECEEFDFVRENLNRCGDEEPSDLIELEAQYCEDKDSSPKSYRFR